MVAGGVAIVGGTALYLLGRREQQPEESTVALSFVDGPRSPVFVVGGRF